MKKCNLCGKEFKSKPYANNVKYCSKKCRNKVHYNTYGAEYQKDYKQRKLLEKYGKEKLVQCQVCKKYFRQVGTHVVEAHGYESAREYREEYGFDVKKGQLPEDYRELKSTQAIECGGVKNLKVGKKFWFKKGQKGVGIYKRSKETMDRLKVLNKFTKLLKNK